MLLKLTIFVLGVNAALDNVNALWAANIRCPEYCTCGMQNLKETKAYKYQTSTLEVNDQHNQLVNNDVLYEEDNLNYLDGGYLLKSVTCIIQSDVEVEILLEGLPKDIESLVLIQGTQVQDKMVQFHQLKPFEDLANLEIYGTQLLGKNFTKLKCNVDDFLPNLKYLNVDNVMITQSRRNFHKIHNDEVTFEYLQQLNADVHPLTVLQKGEHNDILPYKKYKEYEKDKTPSLMGFVNLLLLRINNCELNSIEWEMFDGLQNLEYLFLEKNNLMFIPNFAFYGTPKLKKLSLARNNLLNIRITDLAGLLELEYLDLSYNNFSQLSELSFPPFPKLKLADFGNNPLNIIFPSTFEVMNTTDSIILGGEEIPLALLPNSFSGLKLLKKLTLNNVVVPLFHKELLEGMPNLKELKITGNITKIEYDAFLHTAQLEILVLSKCYLKNISMDAFIGLEKLEVLDLSGNDLQYLQPGTFDHLKNLKELYLNLNRFRQLPADIFHDIHPKLIRLNENPWHCSCLMSAWKPLVINKVKQKIVKSCDFSVDKGIRCNYDKVFSSSYIFNNRVAPKCSTPFKFLNWSVFHVMRKQLKCPNYKPKIKKVRKPYAKATSALPQVKKVNDTNPDEGPVKISLPLPEMDHNLFGNDLNNNILTPIKYPQKKVYKYKKRINKFNVTNTI